MQHVETDVIEISFATPGGTGSLTWGQRSMLTMLLLLGEESYSVNLKSTIAVPSGRSVQDVADAIRTLVERHHGLVTLFPGFATEPYQEVASHGTVPLAVHAAAADEVGRMAAEVRDESAARCFHHEDGWPARFALVLSDGEPRRLVMVFSHLVFDAESLRIVLEELGPLLDGRTLPPADGTWTPLVLAEHEQDPRERARSTAAMGYWRNELRASPHSIFDVPMLGPEPARFRRLRMRSLALAVAAARIAKTHRCTTSAVILAAVAAILGHYTGHARITMWLIASNRWRPQVLRTVAQLTEPGIFSLTLGDMSFGDLAKATWKRALTGYQNAAYDPRDWRAEVDSAQVRRGVYIDRSIVFNDVRRTDGWPQAPRIADTDTALTELCGSTRVELVDQWDALRRKLEVAVRNSEDDATVDLEFDTAFIPDRVARLMLTGMEALVVRAACRAVRLNEVGAITGITPVVRGEGWVHVKGDSWVKPAEVANLVAAVPGVARCAVFTEPDRETTGVERLVAYLVATHPPATLELLHNQLWLMCVNRTDVMAPQHYVLCAGSPVDDSHSGWVAQPVLMSGSGRC